MNKQQKTYTAFIESVCKKFNRTEMAPALKEGFQAFCEAYEVAGDADTFVDASGNTLTDEDRWYMNPSWYDIYVNGELEYRHVSENAVDACVAEASPKYLMLPYDVNVVESGSPYTYKPKMYDVYVDGRLVRDNVTRKEFFDTFGKTPKENMTVVRHGSGPNGYNELKA